MAKGYTPNVRKGGKWQRVIYLQTGRGEVAKGYTPTDREGGSGKGLYT